MRQTVKGAVPDNPETASVPTNKKLADGQYADHWVIPFDPNSGYVRPFRSSYTHTKCGTVTTMPRQCAETYARDPGYYGSTFCCGCGEYFPVGKDGQFTWDNGEKVGT